MEALGWWLMLVGSLRLASVWFGYFDIWALRLAVYSKSSRQSLCPSLSHIMLIVLAACDRCFLLLVFDVFLC